MFVVLSVGVANLRDSKHMLLSHVHYRIYNVTAVRGKIRNILQLKCILYAQAAAKQKAAHFFFPTAETINDNHKHMLRIPSVGSDFQSFS